MTSPDPLPAGPRASATPCPRTVLVVDDDPEILELAAEWLREAGHDVLEAGTGAGAIALFEKHPEIGLLFTDIVMPGIDGLRVAALAKHQRPDVHVLYATGYAGLTEPGCPVHGRILQKPYRGHELIAAVERALTCRRRDAGARSQ